MTFDSLHLIKAKNSLAGIILSSKAAFVFILPAWKPWKDCEINVRWTVRRAP